MEKRFVTGTYRTGRKICGRMEKNKSWHPRGWKRKAGTYRRQGVSKRSAYRLLPAGSAGQGPLFTYRARTCRRSLQPCSRTCTAASTLYDSPFLALPVTCKVTPLGCSPVPLLCPQNLVEPPANSLVKRTLRLSVHEVKYPARNADGVFSRSWLLLPTRN